LERRDAAMMLAAMIRGFEERKTGSRAFIGDLIV
jgi:hypothetical protein